jgi:NAD(P)-dependent dehydrogenase (short-subunit alcohol dehydrogenase family)
MDLGLRDRAAIVTGASRGIGRQVAVDLAAEGCDVVVCGRDSTALAEVAAAVGERGRTAVTYATDLTVPVAAGEIVTACQDAFGRVDILVNNAGIAIPKRFERLQDADWRTVFEINFFAAVRLAQACLPVMRAQHWGRIVNIASTYGVEPDPQFGPYGAAKAALLNVSKAMAVAYSAEGVFTNAVVPGVTLTELVQANADAAAAAQGTTPDEVMAKMMAKHPVAAGRFGLPHEVAAAVVFLSSDQASWVSGAALAVDGSTLHSAS